MINNNKKDEIKQILKYFDIFGTKCSFYVEQTPKLYSVSGGILSITNICVCFAVFIYISLNDFLRLNPYVSFSSIQPNEFQKVNIGKEKIWIPWRIRDYSNHFINHTNIFYPFIYNYYSIRNSFDSGFEFKVKKLNFTLCNQTSFINKSEIFYIDPSLDQLYCIEMDDIVIGGDWTSNFISYIEFDLYVCEEGIDYDLNDPKCTTYENISHYLGQNNSLMMSLYYPIVQFKANEADNPMTVIYRERMYHFSRYTNKIDRIYLQKYILKDDLGWISKDYNETSYWGLNYIQGDSYTTGKKRDLMNEGSTSRVYSFNIYIDPTINTYYRSYKKIYLIFSESIPLIYIVSFIFNIIATFCKFHTINKKFSEFLFVNLKEKTDIFDKKIHEIKQGIYQKSQNDLDNKINNNLQINDNRNIIICEKKSEVNEKNEDNSNLPSQKNVIFENVNQPIIEKIEHNIKDNSLEILNINKSKEMLSVQSNELKNHNVLARKTMKANSIIQKEIPVSEEARRKRKSFNKINFPGNQQAKIQSLFRPMNKSDAHKHFVHKKLFPSSYYFYAIFIKNLNILEKATCFSKKFSKTYVFISRLLDIYSYFDLFRQFNFLKIIFLNEQNLNYVEKIRKINVGEISFMKDIKDCIENNNFRIFGKSNK